MLVFSGQHFGLWFLEDEHEDDDEDEDYMLPIALVLLLVLVLGCFLIVLIKQIVGTRAGWGSRLHGRINQR
jgi:hypothetical protein